ncbi:MAG: DUF3040 domain-containing protein [Pseudonocardia sp.]|nr:DUF3040 domain-containing protein [Pseudonocardia sp.]
MPLSEHEQRLLEQIERALYAEDPKFASSVSGGRSKPARRRRVQGAILFVLGLVLLVVGIAVDVLKFGGVPILSVVGFLAMFGGGLLAVTSIGASGKKDGKDEKSASSPDASPDGGGFTGRMEERFRRRFEQE